MKKIIKRTLATLIIAFAFLGLGTTALAANGYITWGGSQDVQQALENLNLISDRGQELKTERDGYYRDNEQLVNQLKDKDNVINSKTQEIEAKQKEIDQLEQSATNNTDELKQAEKDAKTVNKKTSEVLKGLE